MDKRKLNQKSNNSKEENWVEDIMERQEQDLELEEEILSTVPKRIRHKWLEQEEE